MIFYERLFSNNYTRCFEDRITNIFISLLEILPLDKKKLFFDNILEKTSLQGVTLALEKLEIDAQKNIYFNRFDFSPKRPDAFFKIPVNDTNRILYILFENKVNLNYHTSINNIKELENYDRSIQLADLADTESLIFLGISEKQSMSNDDLKKIQLRLNAQFVHFTWKEIITMFNDLLSNTMHKEYFYLIKIFNEYFIKKGTTMTLRIPKDFNYSIERTKTVREIETKYQSDRISFEQFFSDFFEMMAINFEIKLTDHPQLHSFIENNLAGLKTANWVKQVSNDTLFKARFEISIGNCSVLFQYDLGSERFNIYLQMRNESDKTIIELRDKLTKETKLELEDFTRFGNNNEITQFKSLNYPQLSWSNDDLINEYNKQALDQMLNWLNIVLPFIKVDTTL